jgi:hypothetical protein
LTSTVRPRPLRTVLPLVRDGTARVIVVDEETFND